jgi:serine/threonine protein kinase
VATRHQAGLRVSEYVLETCLGVGTFGEAWQARHHIWEGDHVAIKLPTQPEYVRYLQREGVVVHGLKHPNIVRVLGLDPFAEPPYLVMELVRGPSLRDVLREQPRGLSLDVVRTVLAGMMDGIAAAHEKDVLHRDLKPGNVLLNLRGRPLSALRREDVKLNDFGLGVRNEGALRGIAQSASISREDALVGTLAYLAPEVRDGNRPAGPGSDLYSIGVMLFEMLTGDRPAGAELPSTVRSSVPQALDVIFGKLYARHDRRYESARAVQRDLERLLSIRGRRGGDLPPLPGADRQKRRGLRCRDCGHAGGSGDQFCTSCGRQLVAQVRQCDSCGSYPERQDRFCIYCGAQLRAAGV